MKISLAQTHIQWEDKEANITKAENIIRNINIEIVLFPEMSFTGFSLNTGVTGEDDFWTVERMRSISKSNNKSIGFGWVRKVGNKAENIYTILHHDGTVLSEYTKIHPFSYSGEDKYFNGRDKISIFSFGSNVKINQKSWDNNIESSEERQITFAIFICYDLRFPELFRIVADKVDAVIISSNWPAKRSEHWKTLLRARAIENQVYIFAINCFGDMDGQYYSGDSCVINPNGDVKMMLSDKEGIVSYDLKSDTVSYRSLFPVLNDRRFELYERLKET